MLCSQDKIDMNENSSLKKKKSELQFSSVLRFHNSENKISGLALYEFNKRIHPIKLLIY